MASQNGSNRSYNRRHVVKTVLQQKRSADGAVRRLASAEHRRQASWMPGPTNDLERQRQEFLLDCLLDPAVSGAPSFGIVWTEDCLWATGPTIDPFAHIFDRSVNGRWTVSVVSDIDENGNPGWLFVRV